jgi:hypothetical protein
LRIEEDLGMTDSGAGAIREYFRRDQRDGVSPPDLSKDCSYAEHIVHARGKRTRFTSVSLDLTKIRDFGDTDYRLEREKLLSEQHNLVEHDALLSELRNAIHSGEKAERQRAIQALIYASRRKAGLVNRRFDTTRVERKDLLAWAKARVQPYFTRIR